MSLEKSHCPNHVTSNSLGAGAPIVYLHTLGAIYYFGLVKVFFFRKEDFYVDEMPSAEGENAEVINLRVWRFFFFSSSSAQNAFLQVQIVQFGLQSAVTNSW